MSFKRLKDPIYGYIELDDAVCSEYVDTAGFQRLRRIVQTSYAPLYPSAVHNRFVHSLGVYHLGKHAASVLEKSVKHLFEGNEVVMQHWKAAAKTFRIACLLHDFGHAPFSHSGEDFYTSSNASLDEDLVAIVNDEDYTEDARKMVETGSNAAPHEVMSALLALEQFGESIPNHALFARCITGYKYTVELGVTEQLDNILIELLNSKTIDVDKLDYLIRDSYVVGFDSIAIDHERLLDGLRIVKASMNSYCLCYHKLSLSVLENVVYARDLERKWIQAHPSILYDQFLVQHAIRRVNTSYGSADGKSSLLGREALTSEGLLSVDGRKVRYLSDDDIVFLAKNEYSDALIEEYFNRGARRHPIWKSEAEYRSLFRLDAGNACAIEELEHLLAQLVKDLNERSRDLVLSTELLVSLKEEKTELEGLGQIARQLRARADYLGRLIPFLEAFEDFSNMNDVDFNYVLIDARNFRSGFSANSLNEIKIIFKDKKPCKTYKFEDISGHLESKNETTGLFFIYHRDASRPGFPKEELVRFLGSYFGNDR